MLLLLVILVVVVVVLYFYYKNRKCESPLMDCELEPHSLIIECDDDVDKKSEKHPNARRYSCKGCSLKACTSENIRQIIARVDESIQHIFIVDHEDCKAYAREYRNVHSDDKTNRHLHHLYHTRDTLHYELEKKELTGVEIHLIYVDKHGECTEV